MNVNLLKIIAECLGKQTNFVRKYNITPESRLREDIGLDSMSLMGFLLELEKSIKGFQIDPMIMTMADVQTVESLALYIEKNVATCSLEGAV